LAVLFAKQARVPLSSISVLLFVLFYFFFPSPHLQLPFRQIFWLFHCQIVLYVCSRVVASFLPRAGSARGLDTTGDGTVKPVPPDSRYFSLFAAMSWGAVMWLFQHRGETLQPGMFNAMTYLYRDSER
jgi:hypothetical protein